MLSVLLLESLVRRRRRKLLAVVVVWIGVTLVVGLLTLSLDVGDKMNRELRALGANIKLQPASAAISLSVGGQVLAPAARPTYLDESQLANLKTIFWAHNILAVVPCLWGRATVNGVDCPLVGTRVARSDECQVGTSLARQLHLQVGQIVNVGGRQLRVAGITTTGTMEDHAVIAALPVVQQITGLTGKISEAEISALTTPENNLAEKYRVDPKSLTPAEYDRWYCTPYPGSVAANIQAAIPGTAARVVRRVAETQGVVLTRLEGLIVLLGWLGAVACTLSVMGVLTSAVLERRTEVALLRAIGAHGLNVLQLFLAEAGAVGLIGGALAGLTGLALGGGLVHAVFGGSAERHWVLLLVAPLVGMLTALAASALPVLHTLRQETAQVLHGN